MGSWIWLWHWLPCNPIVWMVLELVGGIGAQYRAPLPHEGKSPPTIPRSPALYSPEITSLPFPDPRAYPFTTLLEKKKRERATPERGDGDGRGDGRLIPLRMRYLSATSPSRPHSRTSSTTSVVIPPCRSVFLLVSFTSPFLLKSSSFDLRLPSPIHPCSFSQFPFGI